MNLPKFIIIEAHHGRNRLEKDLIKISKLTTLTNNKMPLTPKIIAGKIAHIKRAVHKISIGCSSKVPNTSFKYDILSSGNF